LAKPVRYIVPVLVVFMLLSWQDAQGVACADQPRKSMNTTTLIIGIAVLLFGLYTCFFRYANPQKLTKLQALKDLFGNESGDRIHLIVYAILPLAAGAIFVFAGIKGVSLF
jgi:hypothetical protein